MLLKKILINKPRYLYGVEFNNRSVANANGDMVRLNYYIRKTILKKVGLSRPMSKSCMRSIVWFTDDDLNFKSTTVYIYIYINTLHHNNIMLYLRLII